MVMDYFSTLSWRPDGWFGCSALCLFFGSAQLESWWNYNVILSFVCGFLQCFHTYVGTVIFT
jgi:hypothetical protein